MQHPLVMIYETRRALGRHPSHPVNDRMHLKFDGTNQTHLSTELVH